MDRKNILDYSNDFNIPVKYGIFKKKNFLLLMIAVLFIIVSTVVVILLVCNVGNSSQKYHKNILRVLTNSNNVKLECTFTIGSKCYYISNETYSWNESSEWCVNHTSRLLVIKDRNEFNALQKILPNITTTINFWIGLYARPPKFDIKWLNADDETKFDSKNMNWFFPGEPDHSYYASEYDSCVDICISQKILWLCDWHCEMESYFICEQ